MGIKELAGDRAGGGMPIDELLEGLDSERWRILANALTDMRVANSTIEEACRDDGFELERDAAHRWRARHAAILEYPND